MEHRERVKTIPLLMRKQISEKFIDLLLDARDGSRVPSSVAKTILFYWQRDQLHSEAGLINLIRALEIADPVGASSVLREFGLNELEIAFTPP